jgi:superfamily II DNA or RNA helicase
MITELEEIEWMVPIQPRKSGDKETSFAGNDHTIEPRPAQLAALDALHATWEEGYDRAMVVMATGLGKTYLAGFYAKSFRRILFIAHREEILEQARRSFQRIMPERSWGYYNGTEKNHSAEMLFASIYTLGMKKHRERFNPRDFDLIIVDEFHHAAARSYRTTLEYFKPSFLLGITATPERMDGQDIYALCDGNVAYQIHFLEAISRGWLSPFQYYGIYDDIDYSRIRWLGTRYDEDELLAAQLQEARAALIHDAWLSYSRFDPPSRSRKLL